MWGTWIFQTAVPPKGKGTRAYLGTVESVAEASAESEGRTFQGVLLKEPAESPKEEQSSNNRGTEKAVRKRQKKSPGPNAPSSLQPSNPSSGLGKQALGANV